MTTHPEDAMTRERALEIFEQAFEPVYLGHKDDNTALQTGHKAGIEALLAALASAKQEPAPSAEVGEVAREIILICLPGVEVDRKRFADLMQNVTAALRRYAGDGGVTWEPIETAPRGKTMVALLFVRNGFSKYGVGFYMPLSGWHGWDFDYSPTHWLPLPESPAARAKPSEKKHD